MSYGLYPKIIKHLLLADEPKLVVNFADLPQATGNPADDKRKIQAGLITALNLIRNSFPNLPKYTVSLSHDLTTDELTIELKPKAESQIDAELANILPNINTGVYHEVWDTLKSRSIATIELAQAIPHEKLPRIVTAIRRKLHIIAKAAEPDQGYKIILVPPLDNTEHTSITFCLETM